MLNVVSSFSIIPQGNFGGKCLETLNNLMSSGIELKDSIKQVLKENVVPLLNKEDVNDVPRSVLIGLHKIATENKSSDIFNSTTIEYMSFWINAILEYVKRIHDEFNKDVIQLHDQALKLVAASSKNPQNALEMRNFKINNAVSELFKLTTTTDLHNRYISLLNIIENISRADSETGIEFLKTKDVKDSLYKEVTDELLKFFREFKQNKNELRNQQAKDTDEIVKIKYWKFAALIGAYGAFLKYYQFSLPELQNEKITKELISYANLHKVNPVLLTAICNYMLDLLNNEKIKNDKEMVKWLSYELQKLNQLLPYLGGKKYPVACELAEMYQANTFNNGKAVDINFLTNKVMHNLLISIIQLVDYFTENANYEGPIQDVCIEMSKSLSQYQR